MDDEFKIISTIPANPGWWIEYTDSPEDGEEKWYQPVIAWAKCYLLDRDGYSWEECEGLFPVVDGLEGMFVPDITGNGIARYLPGAQFTPSTEPCSGAYYPQSREVTK